jgi:hypothetical protein
LLVRPAQHMRLNEILDLLRRDMLGVNHQSARLVVVVH